MKMNKILCITSCRNYIPGTAGWQHRHQRKVFQETSEYHQPSHVTCSAMDWTQHSINK